MRSLIVILSAALIASAHAQAPPDPRVRVLTYDPSQVFDLIVEGGYAAVVELARDDFVENIVVGNSAVWQVTVNSSGNRVIVKPLPGAVPTDMILVTAERRYVFLLHPSESSGQGQFVLAFTYPDAGSGAFGRTAGAATHKFGGARSLFPQAMRDDGRRTFITWDAEASLPAVYAVDASGQEVIVNGRMVGRDYVVDGVAARFVFRLGDDRAVATRNRVRRAE